MSRRAVLSSTLAVASATLFAVLFAATPATAQYDAVTSVLERFDVMACDEPGCEAPPVADLRRRADAREALQLGDTCAQSCRATYSDSASCWENPGCQWSSVLNRCGINCGWFKTEETCRALATLKETGNVVTDPLLWHLGQENEHCFWDATRPEGQRCNMRCNHYDVAHCPNATDPYCYLSPDRARCIHRCTDLNTNPWPKDVNFTELAWQSPNMTDLDNITADGRILPYEQRAACDFSYEGGCEWRPFGVLDESRGQCAPTCEALWGTNWTFCDADPNCRVSNASVYPADGDGYPENRTLKCVGVCRLWKRREACGVNTSSHCVWDPRGDGSCIERCSELFSPASFAVDEGTNVGLCNAHPNCAAFFDKMPKQPCAEKCGMWDGDEAGCMRAHTRYDAPRPDWLESRGREDWFACDYLADVRLCVPRCDTFNRNASLCNADPYCTWNKWLNNCQRTCSVVSGNFSASNHSLCRPTRYPHCVLNSASVCVETCPWKHFAATTTFTAVKAACLSTVDAACTVSPNGLCLDNCPTLHRDSCEYVKHCKWNTASNACEVRCRYANLNDAGTCNARAGCVWAAGLRCVETCVTMTELDCVSVATTHCRWVPSSQRCVINCGIFAATDATNCVAANGCRAAGTKRCVSDCAALLNETDCARDEFDDSCVWVNRTTLDDGACATRCSMVYSYDNAACEADPECEYHMAVGCRNRCDLKSNRSFPELCYSDATTDVGQESSGGGDECQMTSLGCKSNCATKYTSDTACAADVACEWIGGQCRMRCSILPNVTGNCEGRQPHCYVRQLGLTVSINGVEISTQDAAAVAGALNSATQLLPTADLTPATCATICDYKYLDAITCSTDLDCEWSEHRGCHRRCAGLPRARCTGEGHEWACEWGNFTNGIGNLTEQCQTACHHRTLPSCAADSLACEFFAGAGVCQKACFSFANFEDCRAEHPRCRWHGAIGGPGDVGGFCRADCASRFGDAATCAPAASNGACVWNGTMCLEACWTMGFVECEGSPGCAWAPEIGKCLSRTCPGRPVATCAQDPTCEVVGANCVVKCGLLYRSAKGCKQFAGNPSDPSTWNHVRNVTSQCVWDHVKEICKTACHLRYPGNETGTPPADVTARWKECVTDDTCSWNNASLMCLPSCWALRSADCPYHPLGCAWVIYPPGSGECEPINRFPGSKATCEWSLGHGGRHWNFHTQSCLDMCTRYVYHIRGDPAKLASNATSKCQQHAAQCDRVFSSAQCINGCSLRGHSESACDRDVECQWDFGLNKCVPKCDNENGKWCSNAEFEETKRCARRPDSGQCVRSCAMKHGATGAAGCNQDPMCEYFEGWNRPASLTADAGWFGQFGSYCLTRCNAHTSNYTCWAAQSECDWVNGTAGVGCVPKCDKRFGPVQCQYEPLMDAPHCVWDAAFPTAAGGCVDDCDRWSTEEECGATAASQRCHWFATLGRCRLRCDARYAGIGNLTKREQNCTADAECVWRSGDCGVRCKDRTTATASTWPSGKVKTSWQLSMRCANDTGCLDDEVNPGWCAEQCSTRTSQTACNDATRGTACEWLASQQQCYGCPGHRSGTTCTADASCNFFGEYRAALGYEGAPACGVRCNLRHINLNGRPSHSVSCLARPGCEWVVNPLNASEGTCHSPCFLLQSTAANCATDARCWYSYGNVELASVSGGVGRQCLETCAARHGTVAATCAADPDCGVWQTLSGNVTVVHCKEECNKLSKNDCQLIRGSAGYGTGRCQWSDALNLCERDCGKSWQLTGDERSITPNGPTHRASCEADPACWLDRPVNDWNGTCYHRCERLGRADCLQTTGIGAQCIWSEAGSKCKRRCGLQYPWSNDTNVETRCLADGNCAVSRVDNRTWGICEDACEWFTGDDATSNCNAQWQCVNFGLSSFGCRQTCYSLNGPKYTAEAAPPCAGAHCHVVDGLCVERCSLIVDPAVCDAAANCTWKRDRCEETCGIRFRTKTAQACRTADETCDINPDGVCADACDYFTTAAGCTAGDRWYCKWIAATGLCVKDCEVAYQYNGGPSVALKQHKCEGTRGCRWDARSDKCVLRCDVLYATETDCMATQRSILGSAQHICTWLRVANRCVDACDWKWDRWANGAPFESNDTRACDNDPYCIDVDVATAKTASDTEESTCRTDCGFRANFTQCTEEERLWPNHPHRHHKCVWADNTRDFCFRSCRQHAVNTTCLADANCWWSAARQVCENNCSYFTQEAHCRYYAERLRGCVWDAAAMECRAPCDDRYWANMSACDNDDTCTWSTRWDRCVTRCESRGDNYGMCHYETRADVCAWLSPWEAAKFSFRSTNWTDEYNGTALVPIIARLFRVPQTRVRVEPRFRDCNDTYFTTWIVGPYDQVQRLRAWNATASVEWRREVLRAGLDGFAPGDPENPPGISEPQTSGAGSPGAHVSAPMLAAAALLAAILL